MRQKRYFICLLPALLLAAALCLPARAFSKEPSSWAAEQCKHLEDVGLLDWQLYTGSTDPASAINRGAFCQMPGPDGGRLGEDWNGRARTQRLLCRH